jgi:hypothetical protein
MFRTITQEIVASGNRTPMVTGSNRRDRRMSTYFMKDLVSNMCGCG